MKISWVSFRKIRKFFTFRNANHSTENCEVSEESQTHENIGRQTCQFLQNVCKKWQINLGSHIS